MASGNNRLTFEQKYQVAIELGRREEWLKSEGPTYQKVAEVLSKDIGFTLNGDHVKGVASVAHITWDVKRVGGGGLTKGVFVQMRQRLDALDGVAAELKALKEELANVRAALEAAISSRTY